MRKNGRIDDEGKLSVLCGSNCSNNEWRETLPQSRGGAGPMIVMGGWRGLTQRLTQSTGTGASLRARRSGPSVWKRETMPNTNRLTHFLPNHYPFYKAHWLQRCSVYCLLRENSEIAINFCPLADSIHSHSISICYGCPMQHVSMKGVGRSLATNQQELTTKPSVKRLKIMIVLSFSTPELFR